MKVSGRDEQSAYTPKVQQARNGNANYVYNGSNDVAMTSMRREAAAQGLDTVKVWACSLACYTEKFKAAGADVEGTYTWMQFLPFEDKGSNQELDNYLEAVVTSPTRSGPRRGWPPCCSSRRSTRSSSTDGPNAITRASVLDGAAPASTSFDANGWMGAKNPKSGFSDCMVIMQVEGTAFVRATPDREGQARLQP